MHPLLRARMRPDLRGKFNEWAEAVPADAFVQAAEV
jgi:hypothetical protein